MKNDYKLFPLDNDYQSKASDIIDVRLVILGQDPFPTGATSIPFVKLKWSDLKKGSAGYNVFNSLYEKFPSEYFETPKECAFALLNLGVVFLNCSYHYLDDDTVSKVKHFRFISCAFDVNEPILKRAEVILACGEAHRMLGMVTTVDTNVVKKVPHPSTQSRNNPTIENKIWDKHWSKKMLHNVLSSNG